MLRCNVKTHQNAAQDPVHLQNSSLSQNASRNNPNIISPPYSYATDLSFGIYHFTITPLEVGSNQNTSYLKINPYFDHIPYTKVP